MLQRCVGWFLIFLATALLFGAITWGCDRSEMIHWLGVTDLDIDFLVTAANSGNPIPKARIHIRSEGAFYDGGWTTKKDPLSFKPM